MTEEKIARLKTHRNNIERYRQLLTTGLTDSERQSIQARLLEEQSSVELLAMVNFPPLSEDSTSSQGSPHAA
jgi:hypothetical protein